MAKIVGFVSKSELERIRLIREARAIYDSIFPPANAMATLTQPGLKGPLHRKEMSGG
jgi:hypothetical protein